MQDLLEFVVKSLVDNPGAVRIRERERDRQTAFELTVAPEDVGKVIGRQGRTARALRTLIAAGGSRQRYTLDILD